MDERAAKEHRRQDGACIGVGHVLSAACARAGCAEVAEAPALARTLRCLPRFSGRPIRIRFLPKLRARGGRLVSGGRGGQEVHAGSFMRRREIVLEKDLLGSPPELARVLVHEIFHFVWVRAGNTARRSWEALVGEELERRARGELGWSAEMRKRALGRRDASLRTRAWRDYLCESFCDTAAWILSSARRHEEFTLAEGRRRRRREWFRAMMLKPEISI